MVFGNINFYILYNKNYIYGIKLILVINLELIYITELYMVNIIFDYIVV
jgi:hypothetical protein